MLRTQPESVLAGQCLAQPPQHRGKGGAVRRI